MEVGGLPPLMRALEHECQFRRGVPVSVRRRQRSGVRVGRVGAEDHVRVGSELFHVWPGLAVPVRERGLPGEVLRVVRAARVVCAAFVVHKAVGYLTISRSVPTGRGRCRSFALSPGGRRTPSPVSLVMPGVTVLRLGGCAANG